MLRQTPPLLNPSNVVVPMIAQISATVPGRISRLGDPAQRAAQADHAVLVAARSADSRENRLK